MIPYLLPPWRVQKERAFPSFLSPSKRRGSSALLKGKIESASTAPGTDASLVTSSYVAPVPTHEEETEEDILDLRSILSSDALEISPDVTSEFPDLLRPRSDCDVDQIGPVQLAFLGDVVFELFVRTHYVWPARRTSDLQTRVVDTVRAEAQSELLADLTSNFDLSDKEGAVLARGRNAGTTGGGGKRRSPQRFRGSKNGAFASTYQDSTSFEALVGYTYISNPGRCFEMLNWIRSRLGERDATIGELTTYNSQLPSTLAEILLPHPNCDPDQITAGQLAYVGDALYDLLVRARYVWPNMRGPDLHKKTVSVCRAETQSKLHSLLIGKNSSFLLSAKEGSVLTRGRNSGYGNNGRGQRRRVRGGAGGIEKEVGMLQDSTALEALLGYFYMVNGARCFELLNWISIELDVLDSGMRQSRKS